MKLSAKIIQRAYRRAKEQELARGLQWLERCLGEERRQYDLNKWLGDCGWSLKRKDNYPITDAPTGLKRRKISL